MPDVGRAVRETMSGLPRQFWWLWTSTLVNRLGGFVVTFLALYLTVDRGFSASYAGLVASLYGLGGSIASVVGGVLADRVGRRATMLVAQLGTAAVTALLGFVTHPVAIAVVAGLVGVTSNASRPALQAMLADLVPPKDRVRAFALNYWAINIGFGVSAGVAGLIAAQGYVWLFLGDALMTLLCAIVVFLKVKETLPAADTLPAVDEQPAGLGQVLRDQRFMALVGLTFLLGTVGQQGATTLSVDMGRSGFTASQYGLVIGLNGLLVVLLQIPVTRMMTGRSPAALLAAGALLMGWGFGLTAFAGTVGFYALTVTVWTLGEIVHAPASMAIVSDLAPARARGRYQGMFSLSWSAASFVGPLAGGFALDRWGGEAAWAACAVVGTVTAAGYWALLRTRTAAKAVQSDTVEALEAVAREEVPMPASGPAPASPAAVRSSR